MPQDNLCSTDARGGVCIYPAVACNDFKLEGVNYFGTPVCINLIGFILT